jgi:hypothetical protein
LQQEAKLQYIGFVNDLEFLINSYDNETENVTYIDEMKPSISKTLELFWSRLTESRSYQIILEQIHRVPNDILIKRKVIENELSKMLKLAKSDFNAEDIKDTIYNEDGHDDLIMTLNYFHNIHAKIEISHLLEVLNDAWNYFPHKSLRGLSPIEKISESKTKSENKKELIN